MDKNIIIDYLTKYDFRYAVNSHKITVNLDFAQEVILDFSEPNKMKINDQLTGWNLLTGLIPMTLKHAIIYNFIVAVLVGILFVNLEGGNSGLNFIPFYLSMLLWILLFSGYYLVKLENFKTQIMYVHS